MPYFVYAYPFKLPLLILMALLVLSFETESVSFRHITPCGYIFAYKTDNLIRIKFDKV